MAWGSSAGVAGGGGGQGMLGFSNRAAGARGPCSRGMIGVISSHPPGGVLH